MLAGTDPDKIVECTRRMLVKGKGWKNPFGDGKASDRIAKMVKIEAK
jgi:UDP-N-acetylglucosamine 2-epimerase